ncbi:MAG: RIP metalloprotease RseP [Gemmatimonadota bacterium]
MTTVLATLIVLGVLILVHELGHFWAAKAVGIRVERFSIGLGPRILGFRRGDTEYVLSAIPLGGYVKMGGMDDEVMEAIEGGKAGSPPPDHLEPEEGGTGPVASDHLGATDPQEPDPRGFDAKPIWARTLVISAGVIMNMLFAFVAYTAVAAIWGLQETDTTRLGMVRAEALPPGAEGLSALQPGATFTSVAGVELRHWGDLREAISQAPEGAVEVRTTDPAASVTVTLSSSEADPEARAALMRALLPWQDPVIGAVVPGGPADEAGIRAGDRIIAVEGIPVSTWWEFRDQVAARPELRTEVLLARDGGELVRAATPQEARAADPVTGEMQTVGQMGVFPEPQDVTYIPVGPGEALAMGAQETVYFSGLILGFLGDLFTGGISPRSLGSIVTIGEASGEAAEAGMAMFLRFMAFFSINLAILNLLPIPVLDGGHLVFLAIEAVRGRALSVEQRMRWSQVGFVVIMGIMLLALSNDFLRLLGF